MTRSQRCHEILNATPQVWQTVRKSRYRRLSDQELALVAANLKRIELATRADCSIVSFWVQRLTDTFRRWYNNVRSKMVRPRRNLPT